MGITNSGRVSAPISELKCIVNFCSVVQEGIKVVVLQMQGALQDKDDITTYFTSKMFPFIDDVLLPRDIDNDSYKGSPYVIGIFGSMAIVALVRSDH